MVLGAPVAVHGGERAGLEEGHPVGGGRPRVPRGDAHRARGGVLGKRQGGVLRAHARAPGGTPPPQGGVIAYQAQAIGHVWPDGICGTPMYYSYIDHLSIPVSWTVCPEPILYEYVETPYCYSYL